MALAVGRQGRLAGPGIAMSAEIVDMLERRKSRRETGRDAMIRVFERYSQTPRDVIERNVDTILWLLGEEGYVLKPIDPQDRAS